MKKADFGIDEARLELECGGKAPTTLEEAKKIYPHAKKKYNASLRQVYDKLVEIKGEDDGSWKDEEERKEIKEYVSKTSKCPYCPKTFEGSLKEMEEQRINHIKDKHPEKRPFEIEYEVIPEEERNPELPHIQKRIKITKAIQDDEEG